MMQVASLSLPACPEACGRSRRLIDEVCATLDCAADVRHGLLLATTEAVTNAVRHAYEGDGVLELQVEHHEDVLLVVVVDHGVGCEAPSADPGAGLGVGIMEALADCQRMSTHGGGTTVRLRFDLAR